jgi:hypothetical protein
VLGHTVVDLHERAPGVLNVDIEHSPGSPLDSRAVRHTTGPPASRRLARRPSLGAPASRRLPTDLQADQLPALPGP